MPLSTEMVGQQIPALEHQVDARWLMAYAAGLNDTSDCYMDTTAGPVTAHPMFPVCPEWPVILKLREMAGGQTLSAAEASRGVHAAHDLHIHRPIKAGDRIQTTATMIGINQIKPGAAYTLRLDTRDAKDGTLLAQTYQLGIYRGVEISGEGTTLEPPPALPKLSNLDNGRVESIDIGAGAAHVYTECARIWNPIHTDRKVAIEAGLPDIILHGTATLALAVSSLVKQYAGGDPRAVTRLGGRFAAMVLLPSQIKVVSSISGDTISFQVHNAQGEPAVSKGYMVLG
ncbi:MAG: MaoC/PaaZ C-terminal domain-containing protein [Pseudomonadaceae bacterium]|nr:MaoC/PaaZ C-terminal domain-containing protein [Pseudomonadaceae bacterium]